MGSFKGGVAVQLDLATFPSHDIVDISNLFVSFDVDLDIDADNGSATVTLTEMPADAAERVRLYIYGGENGDTDLIFNGEIVHLHWHEDGKVTLTCQDAMARLRAGWSKDDRTYNAAGSATDGSVIQNLVEASGIDSTLTHITSTSWALGVYHDVVLHGGGTITATGAPGPCDVPLELIRRIDEATPLYATYSRGDGAVYRTPRVASTGTPDLTYANGDIWGVTRDRDATMVRNACAVRGAIGAAIPGQIETLYQEASSWVMDPPKYLTEEIDNDLIEDQTHSDAVALAIVTERNARLNTVSMVRPLDYRPNPGLTIQVTKTTAQLSSQKMLVTHVHHHGDEEDMVTTITAEYRQA